MPAVRHSFLILLSLFVFLALTYAEEAQATADEWRSKGDEAFKLRRFDVATEYYTKAIETEPDNYLYHYQRALVFTLRGRPNFAIEDFNSVLAINPTHFTSLLKRGQLHVNNGHFDEAERDFEAALQLKKSTKAEEGLRDVKAVKSVLNRAEKLTAEENWQEAATAWEEVLNFSSTTLRYLLARVDCLIHLEAYGDALSEAVKALRLNPRSMNSHMLLGKIYLLQGDFDSAYNYYKKALNFDPENRDLIKTIKKTKKIIKTLAAFEEAHNENRWEDAKESFMTAAELSEKVRENVHLIQKLSKAQLELRQYQEAISTCTDALARDPNAFECLLNRGEAYLMQDQFQEARNDFNAARQANQNDRRPMEALHRLERKEKMALRKDYYKIMGVPKDANAREIKKAYRKLALANHPDKHPEEEKESYIKKFQEITEAYEILSDEDKRSRYDRGEDLDVRQQQGGGGFNPFQSGGFQFHFQHG